MLAKKYRLPVQSVINRKAQVFFKGKYLTLKVFLSTRPYGRVGVVVGKKTSALATGRNLLKRLVYNSVSQSDLLGNSKDVLVILDRTASGDPRAMIEEFRLLSAKI